MAAIWKLSTTNSCHSIKYWADGKGLCKAMKNASSRCAAKKHERLRTPKRWATAAACLPKRSSLRFVPGPSDHHELTKTSTGWQEKRIPKKPGLVSRKRVIYSCRFHRGCYQPLYKIRASDHCHVLSQLLFFTISSLARRKAYIFMYVVPIPRKALFQILVKDTPFIVSSFRRPLFARGTSPGVLQYLCEICKAVALEGLNTLGKERLKLDLQSFALQLPVRRNKTFSCISRGHLHGSLKRHLVVSSFASQLPHRASSRCCLTTVQTLSVSRVCGGVVLFYFLKNKTRGHFIIFAFCSYDRSTFWCSVAGLLCVQREGGERQGFGLGCRYHWPRRKLTEEIQVASALENARLICVTTKEPLTKMKEHKAELTLWQAQDRHLSNEFAMKQT